MFAIIGYKRPDQAHEGKVEVAFEIRTLGCFNGLNCERAFTPTPFSYAQTNFDLVISNVASNGNIDDEWMFGIPNRQSWQTYPMQCDRHLAMRGLNDDRLVIANNRDGWECIGLGYLSYESGNQQLTYEQPYVDMERRLSFTSWRHPRPNWPNSLNADTRAASMLARNSIFKSYYDGYSGDDRMSYRKCTDNERFMRVLFDSLCTHSRTSGFSPAFKSSRVLNAVTHNNSHHMLLIEMVGSERPAGLAVSYLQIYRNLGEKLVKQGVAAGGLTPSQTNILKSMYDNWNRSALDPIPFISTFVNNGSDSDIVNFAGHGFVGYAIKHSLLNCAHMSMAWRTSMVAEGRYAKGYQSHSIKTHFEQKLRELPKFNDKFVDVSNILTKFTRYIVHGDRKPSLDHLEYQVRSEAEGAAAQARASGRLTELMTTEQQVEMLSNLWGSDILPWLTKQLTFSLKDMLGELKEVLREGVPSFQPRPQRASAVQLSEGALGFNAWVQQAEGQRPEPQAAEAEGIFDGLRELGADVPAFVHPVDAIINPFEGLAEAIPADRIVMMGDAFDPTATSRYEAPTQPRDAQGRFATRH